MNNYPTFHEANIEPPEPEYRECSVCGKEFSTYENDDVCEECEGKTCWVSEIVRCDVCNELMATDGKGYWCIKCGENKQKGEKKI